LITAFVRKRTHMPEFLGKIGFFDQGVVDPAPT